MPYLREIPRDLFNESKLLKCLGQISLLIEDRKCHRWPLRMEHNTDYHDGFEIDQEPSEGSIFCSNLHLYCGETKIDVHTPLNSRGAYPLLFSRPDDEDGEVFNDDGSLTDEFKTFLDGVKPNE